MVGSMRKRLLISGVTLVAAGLIVTVVRMDLSIQPSTGITVGEVQRTTFNGRVIYQTIPVSARAYAPGLHALTKLVTPAGVEESSASLGGSGGGVISFSLGGAPDVNAAWGKPIALKTGTPFAVNGHRYQVPAKDRGAGILVLPLAHGIVWATPSLKPLTQPVLYTGQTFKPNPASLQGTTPIFYTPYGKGGSLTAGAQLIARVPWRWPALNGPVAASAWTGWLPRANVQLPSSVAVQAHLLHYARATGPNMKIVSNIVERKTMPGFPSLFLRQVGLDQSGKAPCVATVSQFDRTRGGFVLEIRLIDPNYGMSAGMVEAAYYWSEVQGTWTPLTQLSGYQTLDGFLNVGRDAVYWEQPLPEGNGNGTQLGLAQMRFNPSTGRIASVWAGGFIYGESFVDGATWVYATPQSATHTRWTEYTPAAAASK